MQKNDLNDIVSSLKRMAYSEKLAGVDTYFTEGKGDEPVQKSKIERIDVENVLAKCRKDVEGCNKCQLAKTRTNIVFGDGNMRAELMFVGEAPGRDEDEQGKPFVGRAGQLLTKIIEAMGLKREDVFIANILKCRPPENRNPLPEEIAVCRGYLEKQIDTIKPKAICALGKFSAQTLLNTETPITKLRGEFFEYRGITLMPTYHPAYLLRNPSSKKEVWEDMQKLAKKLGLRLPKK